jgi:hypothetical protein
MCSRWPKNGRAAGSVTVEDGTVEKTLGSVERPGNVVVQPGQF